MPTIELGEVTAGSRTEPTGWGRTAPASRPRSVGRPVWLAAVLVGLLGTVAGANPFPGQLPAAEVPARLGATVFGERDWLFMANPARPGDGARELVAYRLPGFEPRWRLTLPAGEFDDPRLLGDILLLASYPEPARNRAGRVTAVDTSTGAVGWDRDKALLTVTGAGDVLLWSALASGRPGAGAPERPPGTLELVDPASGDVRWSLPVPAGARPSFGAAALDPAALDRSSTMVLTLPSGRVEVRDLRTGAVVRTTELPPPGDGPEARWHGEIIGDLFLVYEDRSVTGYGLPGLDRRWSAPIDYRQEYGPSDCGADLCSFGHQSGVRVWDARTGGTRWADERWTQVWPSGDVLLAAGRAGSRPGESLYVLDPATGRVLADLGVWEVFDRRGSRYLGVRYAPDRRAWVVEFDPTTWRSRILAVLPEISGDCGLAGETLYCRRLDASIGVWRLPR